MESSVKIEIKKNLIWDILKYPAFFLVTVLAAILMLYGATNLPQDVISMNTAESADFIYEEGLYPFIFDKADSARLDNWTDALIIMESSTMTNSESDSVWRNPRYVVDGKNPVESLYSLVHSPEEGRMISYNRYWMGFRLIVRLLLCFFNYAQIRRYLAIVLITLLVLVANSVMKNTNRTLGILFVISIMMVRPHILCYSLQFSNCFLIALLAMLAVPWVYQNQELEGLYFMELGMLTMFFDFYTTPLVTFGLPMAYLAFMRITKGERETLPRVLKNLAIWFTAYGAMWLCKMLLTNWFTDVDSLKSGMNALLGWVGADGFEKENGVYSVSETFSKLWIAITAGDEAGMCVIELLISGFAIFLGINIYQKRIDWQSCKKNLCLIIVALIPIIWFIITKEPTRQHYWFQYRSIAVFYWALAGYFCTIIKQKNC